LFFKNRPKQEDNKVNTILDIRLTNEKYFVGDTVNGTFIMTGNRPVKAKHFRLEAFGEERTRVREGVGPYKRKRTIRSYERFFFVDLSSFLKSTEADAMSSNGSIDIVKGVTREIPFQFAIPNDALETYNGKNVSVDYKIKAVADRSFRPDIICEKAFIVLCPTHSNIRSSPRSSKNSLSMTPNTLEKSDLPDYEHSVINTNLDSKVFYPGDIIRGMIHLKNKGGKDANNMYYEGVTPADLRNIEVRLFAVERATTSGYKDESRFLSGFKEEAKFEKNIRKIDLKMNKEYYGTSESIIPFDIQIPRDAKQSYRGKISSYYWIVDTKVDMPLRKDIHINSMIEITI
jgi:hypothetical protein